MQELYILATKLKFCPKNLTIGWKEDPYLWMCELQRWLREVYKIHIELSYELYMKWFYMIVKAPYKESDDIISYSNDEGFETYEIALEKALYESLKLIK